MSRTDGPWWTGLPGTGWNDELPGDAFAGAVIAQACAEHVLGAPAGRGEVMPRDVEQLAGKICDFLARARDQFDAYLRRVLACIVCSGNVRPPDVPRQLETRYRHVRRMQDALEKAGES